MARRPLCAQPLSITLLGLALAAASAGCGADPVPELLGEGFDPSVAPVSDAELAALVAAAESRATEAAEARLALAHDSKPAVCADKSAADPLGKVEAARVFASRGQRHPMLSSKASDADALVAPAATSLVSRLHVPDVQARGVILAPITRPPIGVMRSMSATSCGGDADHDGWWNGPCNERRTLTLSAIHCNNQSEIGHDEVYVLADDVRFPNSNMDDSWSMRGGDTRSVGRVIASRVRGVGAPTSFAKVSVQLWEDDFEVWNEWTADTLYANLDVDLGQLGDGQTFTRRLTSGSASYDLTFQARIEYFADPTPGADGDADQDGIRESAEYLISKDFGGLADPGRKEAFVEVDVMAGHALPDQVKALVTTQYYRHGVQLHLDRDEVLPKDGCVTVPEARALYQGHFGRKLYNGYRYAVIGEELWNNASGVAWADTFFVDDSTWWIGGAVLPLAGTFIHELGHTMGLRMPDADGTLVAGEYKWIDHISWLSYDSAMNYTFQPTMVDYSGTGSGGDTGDHNDWEDVDPRVGLRWSFGATTSTETAHCGG